MSRTISFPISTYIDFKTNPTQVTDNIPKPYGVITKVKVDPAEVLTAGHSADLEAFIRHFRHWKYSGTKVSVVPVARAPVDPAHMTYNASMPSIDPFDLMLFHAWKRWTNRPQTVPITGLDAYFIMDKSWKKCSVLRGFSMFARPMVSGLGYTVPTNPFTLTGGPTSDVFNPRNLAVTTTEPMVDTGAGEGIERVEPYVTQRGDNTLARDLSLHCEQVDVDSHRHNICQLADADEVAFPAGRQLGYMNTATPSVLEVAKAKVDEMVHGKDPNNPYPVRVACNFEPLSRYDCRQAGKDIRDVPGLDQANMTGPVATIANEPTRPSGSPSHAVTWGTTTAHNHNVELTTNVSTMLARMHTHEISNQDIADIQGRHTHPLDMQNITDTFEFNYPTNDAPWWQADTHAVTVGSRRMTGWQDTRVVDFGASGVSTHIRSPTYPIMLWRIPSHWHTTYTFRLWMKHYFALRSPITHEIYTGSNSLTTDLCEELRAELHRPSVVAGTIEVADPANQAWLDDILSKADQQHMVPDEEEFTTI